MRQTSFHTPMADVDSTQPVQTTADDAQVDINDEEESKVFFLPFALCSEVTQCFTKGNHAHEAAGGGNGA